MRNTMDLLKTRFMQALKASLEQKTVGWEEEIPPEDWQSLFQFAQAHHVLPMIYEAVYNCPAAQKADTSLFAPFRQRAKQMFVMQALKTSAFLQLLPALRAAGVTPVVVKGIVCRELYPNPDARMSADEDILIPPEQFPVCHRVLLESGMRLCDPEVDPSQAYEVPYRSEDGTLYLEVHKHLFPPESDAYGDFNRFFEGVHHRAVTQMIQGTPVPTMAPTDHLLYLICHSFKHFLHSGFGIRQVCDICLFANAHGAGINWRQIFDCCRQIHGEYFTAALFRIGENHLTFDPEQACWPDFWRALAVDEMPMLEDLLDSGVYGGGSMSRKHSSTMTLHAVAAQKQGKKGNGGVLRALFPSAASLSGRYPYLKERPYLLPAAWADRIAKYRKETAAGDDTNSAAASVKIGKERIALLQKYGIIR